MDGFIFVLDCLLDYKTTNPILFKMHRKFPKEFYFYFYLHFS